MKIQKHNVTVEDLGITISTGKLAKQANGAVTIECGDTSVFVSATAANQLKPDQGFFPLTVDYREKFTAAGRFPGGYFKREGRPTEKEILTSRLCDRPLRPLFPKGFMNDVQIIGLLLSTDLVNEPDILMVNGASAALMCSDIPFNGPIGCVRIGEIDGEFIVNPTNDQLFESRLDLIYVGNEKDMMMIEGSADQLTEERFVEALELAHQKVQSIIQAQKDLAAKVNIEKSEFPLVTLDDKVYELFKKHVGSSLEEAIFQKDKKLRSKAISEIKEKASEAVKAEIGEENYESIQGNIAFDTIQEEIYRKAILEKDARVDNRNLNDLRPIDCAVGVLPRVHGSALFERGETQALVTTTLGTSKDAQELDAVTGGPQSKSFILHYNFPPFSVGETGRFGGVGRREIGHGALAERSLLPIVPPEEEFPYSIRLVSEILESNGSSSMASICGGCLALMDAGVPIIAPVSGISIGLVTESDKEDKITKYKLLTDILGDEDHFGDMDFKVAGTREGITGFQLDLKIKGLPIEIAKEAIIRNKEARLAILDIMAQSIKEPRAEINEYAPRIHKMYIDPDKIGALIGPGGKNIKRIIEVTGAQVDINEDNSGEVSIYSTSREGLERAIEEVQLTVAEIEVGTTYNGVVKATRDYGAIVECLPGKEGLVHISELAEVPVDKVEDVCKEGDTITVKCIGVDDRGRVKLSRKAALCEAKGIPYEHPQPRESRGGGRGGDRGGRRGGGDRRHSRGRDRARS